MIEMESITLTRPLFRVKEQIGTDSIIWRTFVATCNGCNYKLVVDTDHTPGDWERVAPRKHLCAMCVLKFNLTKMAEANKF